ncbi:hypothetical protein CFP56_037852 [Quercus suber]|uniref:Uncharacterized protein n=1 Tax=Quercus suber TaxID=58331 RepID=A0AAW0J3V0_QUESU
MAKEFKGGKKYEIDWLNGRPIGPHARDLINEYAQVVLIEVEMTWLIMEYVKVEGREQEIWRQMGRSYSNYRDHLKTKWFKPYGEATEEARANVPPELGKDDLNFLVDLWSKQDYMDMCLINKENQSKNDTIHTSGSKCF